MLKRRIRLVLIAGSMAVAMSPVQAMQVGPSFTDSALAKAIDHSTIVADLEKRPLGLPSLASKKSDIGTGETVEVKQVSQLGLSRTLGSLIVVVGLILALVLSFRWLSARKGGIIASLGASGRAPSGIIEILARYPVARTQRLVLLQIGGRVILCCQTTGAKSASGAMTTLSELTDPEEVAAIIKTVRNQDKESNQASFNDALKKAEVLSPDRTPNMESVLKYTSPEGDTVHWRDERVELCADQPKMKNIEPSVGRLKARLAAMRTQGESA